MSTGQIISDVRPAGNAQAKPERRPRHQTPLFAVYGEYNGDPQLFQEPVVRQLRAGDIAELGGRYVRMVANHNGQRLQTYDVHDEVCAAFERLGVAQ